MSYICKTVNIVIDINTQYKMVKIICFKIVLLYHIQLFARHKKFKKSPD